jgi:hypothetical protein
MTASVLVTYKTYNSPLSRPLSILVTKAPQINCTNYDTNLNFCTGLGRMGQICPFVIPMSTYNIYTSLECRVPFQRGKVGPNRRLRQINRAGFARLQELLKGLSIS